jgi:hypothetical protein
MMLCSALVALPEAAAAATSTGSSTSVSGARTASRSVTYRSLKAPARTWEGRPAKAPISASKAAPPGAATPDPATADPTTVGVTSAATTSGFVASHGTELTVNGQPWKFAGYNLPCANPFDLTASSLSYYLQDIQANSHANVIRVWFYQSEGGPGNWTAFDAVISALQSLGMRAIVTLTNETSTCDEPDLPNATYKTLGWYQSGYQSPEGGYSLSFEQYAEDVMPLTRPWPSGSWSTKPRHRAPTAAATSPAPTTRWRARPFAPSPTT